MPRHIIRPCIFAAVKPYQLVAALMHQAGLGALPLAKKMGKPKLQPQIHRFVKGEVLEPARTTAAPMALFFGIPIDAMYDEKVATAVAKERGLSELPTQLISTKPPRPKRSDESDARKLAADIQRLSPAERQRLRMMMMLVRDPKRPGENWRAPGADKSQPIDDLIGGISGLTELDEARPPAKPKRSAR